MIVSKVAFTKSALRPSIWVIAFAKSASMPMIVVPLVAMNSSGAYVASSAMVRLPLDWIEAGSIAAMVASLDCVGIAVEDVDLVVVAGGGGPLEGLLLTPAAVNAPQQIATTGAHLRKPRMNTCQPPLVVGTRTTSVPRTQKGSERQLRCHFARLCTGIMGHRSPRRWFFRLTSPSLGRGRPTARRPPRPLGSWQAARRLPRS